MRSMKGPSEQRGLFSRLPDDPDYWLSFTDRIVADAGPALAMFRESGREWWSEIARFSKLLAVGAAAAILASFFLVPAAGGAEPRAGAMDAYGLFPADPLAVTLASRETPPSMEMLIAVRNAESEQ